MKTCMICGATPHDSADTCGDCGEASFADMALGAATTEQPKTEPVADEAPIEQTAPSRRKGR